MESLSYQAPATVHIFIEFKVKRLSKMGIIRRLSALMVAVISYCQREFDSKMPLSDEVSKECL